MITQEIDQLFTKIVRTHEPLPVKFTFTAPKSLESIDWGQNHACIRENNATGSLPPADFDLRPGTIFVAYAYA